MPFIPDPLSPWDVRYANSFHEKLSDEGTPMRTNPGACSHCGSKHDLYCTSPKNCPIHGTSGRRDNTKRPGDPDSCNYICMNCHLDGQGN